MTKQEIRQEIRERRRTMSAEEWQEKSRDICKTIRHLPEYQQASLVYAYLAKHGEVLLDELILDAWSQGKTVAVPKVLGEEMEFFILRDLKDVESGCMGIREPLSREPVCLQDLKACQDLGKNSQPTGCSTALMLLPAVAVDEQLHRVGYGGGYYDKYLEKHPELIKVAVAFEFQVYPQVPTEPFDIPLDGMVTEIRVVK